MSCGAQEVFDLGTGFIGADYLFFRHSFYTGQPASERQGKRSGSFFSRYDQEDVILRYVV